MRPFAQDLARAAILGLASLVATIPIFVLVNWLRGTPNRTANPVQPPTRALKGFPALGTYLIHSVLIVLGLVLPVFELLVWISDGVNRQLTFVSQWDAAFATLLLSALGALLTLIMVLSPAWLSVQRSSLYKNAVYLSSALPGVLLAFGLMVTCLFITKYTGGLFSRSWIWRTLVFGLFDAIYVRSIWTGGLFDDATQS